MASVEVSHTFVSPKPDSTDTTIVSSSEWNALEKFGGGVNGQTPARNSADPQGASWVHGPAVSNNQNNHSGVAPSPPLAVTTITFNSNAVVMLFVVANCVTSNSSAGIVELYRDGVLRNSAPLNIAGQTITARVDSINEVPGTHTYHLVITSGGATITSSFAQLVTLVIGVL